MKKIVYYCYKYDVATTIATCQDCWYRKAHLTGCEPIAYTCEIEDGKVISAQRIDVLAKRNEIGEITK